jgi:hypothetical protein
MTEPVWQKPRLLAFLLAGTAACVERSSPPSRVIETPSAAQLTVPITTTAAAASSSKGAIKRLMLADAKATWDPQSVIREDIDCDGRVDSAFVGHSDSAMYVGVVPGGGTPAEVLQFGLHGNAVQDAVCSDKAKLKVESLDYDPTDAVGELPGFQRSRVCKGLNLGEDDCDSIHMYWNHASHHLDWWRA